MKSRFSAPGYGMCVEKPRADTHHFDALNRADKALYEAKNAGRNTVCSDGFVFHAFNFWSEWQVYMTSNGSIRPATPQEAELLSRLAYRSKLYWGYSPQFMQACRQELTLSPDDIRRHATFVITTGRRVTAFYALEHQSPEFVELAYLFVDPSSIRKGQGRALMAHAVQEARKRAYRTMVIQGDPNAEAFYRAVGAVRAGTKPSASIPDRQLPVFHLKLED